MRAKWKKKRMRRLKRKRRKMRQRSNKPGSCIIMKFQAFLPVKKSFGISIQWCKLGVGDDAANLQRSAMKGLNFIGILNLNLSFKNQRKSFQEKNYCNRQIST
ncbi:hypothetical protein CUMW_000320 [Citrus unshiu]|nr:hypothetical protein CUMW_000320 [Citrus unshiu]